MTPHEGAPSGVEAETKLVVEDDSTERSLASEASFETFPNSFREEVFVPEDKFTPTPNKLRVFNLCLCFLSLSIARSIQGSTMNHLARQTNGELSHVTYISLGGILSFPLGNYLGGFILDRVHFSPVMACSTLSFLLLQMKVAFANSFHVLLVSMVLCEFTMGVIDTGCNVGCLTLLKGLDRGPYFNLLHFFFGIGNVLGPWLVKQMLDQPLERSYEVSDISSSNRSLFCINQLQMLYCLVSAIAFVSCLIFAIFSIHEAASKWTTVITFRGDDNQAVAPKNGTRAYIIMSLMIVLFFCSHGITFSFGHFISTYALLTDLTPSTGSLLTSLFFGVSCLSKLSMVLGVKFIHPAQLVCFNVLCLLTGVVFFLFTRNMSVNWLVGAIILISVGASTIFSNGVIWLEKSISIGKVTPIFLIATSAGAQAFKIPTNEAILVDPMNLGYITLGATLVIGATFWTTFHLLSSSRKPKFQEMTEPQPEPPN